jgi:hypothetical protein
MKLLGERKIMMHTIFFLSFNFWCCSRAFAAFAFVGTTFIKKYKKIYPTNQVGHLSRKRVWRCCLLWAVVCGGYY